LKILHTSDWHIGRNLNTKKRYEEFTLFLDWLAYTIEHERIDLLLICGDIFDTTIPSHHSQQLYYQFLNRVSTTHCQSIIITGGNHDSPTFLDAPKELLENLHVYVVGAMRKSLSEEVITFYNNSNIPQAIICAVPYLRDKDIRTVESGETIDDKNSKLITGIKAHYDQVCSLAEAKQSEYLTSLQIKVPIIAMGHLFCAGGKVSAGDGVRDLYVGSLGYVHENIFPLSIDYLALGHLHSTQKVGGKEYFRYSGSPIPMSFSEATQQKNVLIISFENSHPSITEYPVPLFQKLKRIKGTLIEIQQSIESLIKEESDAWLEIELSEHSSAKEAKIALYEQVEHSKLSIIRIKDIQFMDSILDSSYKNETLDDVDEYEVFERLLTSHSIENPEKEELIESYKEIVFTINNEDTLKE
jgi:exonuclease SbcD